MTSISKLAAAAAAVLIFVAPVSAATFPFNMTVVESVDSVPSPDFDLPDVGSLGFVSFVLDAAALDADGDPSTGVGIDMPLPQSQADASGAFLGSRLLTADLTATSIFGFPGGARFSNGAFSNITIGLTGVDCSALSCTLAGSFEILNAAYAAPTTFADVALMLADPSSTAVFRFNGSVQGESVSFRAESAPIPLPAAGAMLILGFGLMAAFRMRPPA